MTVGSWLDGKLTQSLRLAGYAVVHASYPELCDGLKLQRGDRSYRCGNCGWSVTFEEGSPKVERQVRP